MLIRHQKCDKDIRFQNLFQNQNYFLDWPLSRIKFGTDLKLINDEKKTKQLFLKLFLSLHYFMSQVAYVTSIFYTKLAFQSQNYQHYV